MIAFPAPFLKLFADFVLGDNNTLHVPAAKFILFMSAALRSAGISYFVVYSSQLLFINE